MQSLQNSCQLVDDRGRCKLLADPRKILYVGKKDCKSATFGMLCTAVDQAVNNPRIEKLEIVLSLIESLRASGLAIISCSE